jgi:hypothetical protein
MRLPDDLKKCVVFIGINNPNTNDITWNGTGFFVRILPSIPNQSIIYLITAKHNLIKLGDKEYYVRMNTKDGKSVVFKGEGKKGWWFHPNETESVDVALIQMHFPNELRPNLDFAALPIEMFATKEVLIENNIGTADEVVAVGLFTRHAGNEKNIPIVRTGNIAMMPDEPVPTSDFGNMTMYLIESRSMGGLSGSPVIVLKPQPQYGTYKTFVIGLMQGHWEVDPKTLMDIASDSSQEKERINMGIALVTPAVKIVETINQAGLVKSRESQEKAWLEKNPPAPD